MSGRVQGVTNQIIGAQGVPDWKCDTTLSGLVRTRLIYNRALYTVIVVVAKLGQAGGGITIERRPAAAGELRPPCTHTGSPDTEGGEQMFDLYS